MSKFIKTLSYTDVKKSQSFYGERVKVSDYAKFYGCKLTDFNGVACGAYWLDELYYGAEIYIVDSFGRLNHELACQNDIGVCPGLDEVLKPFLSSDLQFGMFPQTEVDYELFKMILSFGKTSGKKYPARTDGYESEEYIYKGKPYAIGRYNDKIGCFKVEPIVFKISESGVIRASDILMVGPFCKDQNYLNISYSGSLLEKSIKDFENSSGIEKLVKMGWYEAKRVEFDNKMKELYRSYKHEKKLNKAKFIKNVINDNSKHL